MNRSMTLAIERIADEPAFAERFRQHPEGALRRYGLTASQIDAIKDGSAASLHAEGVDVEAFARGRRHGLRPRLRRVAAVAGIVGGLVWFSVAPAAAGRYAPRHGLVRAARRSPRLTPRIRASGIRAGLTNARRHGGRLGARHSGLRAGLRANGISLTDKEPFALGD